ncbi:hypothetical protein, partial [Klebsiella pneumoniae]|uniref:hypothetical protein n=1 Tax=Klebsiella pneumoniae TaxID=573 RepID=UPI001C55C139
SNKGVSEKSQSQFITNAICDAKKIGISAVIIYQIRDGLPNNSGRCEQVPDMRSSYSSGAHPRGTS